MSYQSSLGQLRVLCVSQAQKDAANAACKKVQVKGLGETDPCWLASLPVCVPGYVPVDTGDEPGGQKTLMFGGILLLVLAAGGYALYRGAKK